MDVHFWAATDVGRTRDHNEDNFLVDKKLNLFVVADGMGGHAAGEVASSVAVREVRRVIADGRDAVEEYAASGDPGQRERVLKLIESAIETACAKVFALAQENASRKGMGTTLSLLMVAGDRGFIGHVGDSRIYLVRRSSVHQITEDHSLINELIKRGRLKPGDAFDSPYKNAVTRAVGVYETVEVDAFDIDVLPDDNFLICSDGLSCYLDDDITRSYMTHEEVKTIPDELIRLANDKGGKDNITAIVVRMEVGENAPIAQERVTLVQRKTNALQSQPLFRYFTYGEVMKVLNLSTRETLDSGQVLFSEGERVPALHVILSGRMTVHRNGQKLMDLEADGILGEHSLVDDVPRLVTVRAAEKTDVLTIGREALHGLMLNQPRIAWKLLWSLNQQLSARLRNSHRALRRVEETAKDLAKNSDTPFSADTLDPEIHWIGHSGIEITDEIEPPFVDLESDRPTDPLFQPASGTAQSADVSPPGRPDAVNTLDIRPEKK